MWCGGRRREAVGGSSARRRLCGGSSSPVHVAQNDPCACERAKGGKVRGGRLQRRRRWPQGLRRAYRRLGDGRRDGSASVGGTGTGAGDAPCATIKRRRKSTVRRQKNCQKRGEVRGRGGGAGGELGGAGITRGKHAGAMRGARRAVGCSPTQLQSPRHGELDLPTTEEPSGPPAVPPRGVEPRTLPTIRPTGRPGQRLFSSVKRAKPPARTT